MQSKEFKLTRYDADPGKVFDWADLEAHQYEDADGNMIQEHLYAVALFIGGNDSINNYVEVDAPVVEEEPETVVEGE